MKKATAPVSRRAAKTAIQAAEATTGRALTAKAPVRPKIDADPAALLLDLRALVQSARQRLAAVANATYTLLCWQIGRRLLRDNLQGGRAAYGKQILATVSQELTAEFGAGFNYTALTRMARFAEWMTDERIVATLSQTLGWSHFVELLPIKDPLARDFYAEVCAASAGTCARCGRRSAACCTSAPRCRRSRSPSSRRKSASCGTGR